MSTPWTGDTLGEGLEAERGRFPRSSPGARGTPGRGRTSSRGGAAPPPARRYPPPARRRPPRPWPWIFRPPGYPYASYPEPEPEPVRSDDAAAAPPAEPDGAAAAEPGVVQPASAEPAVDEPRPEEPTTTADQPPEEEAWEGEALPSSRGPSCEQPLVHTALPTSGPGFYTYTPARRRFGMAETVQALLRMAAGWAAANPQGPRIGIGDLSMRCGGTMAGHASHRRGIDADIRPVRVDGMEGPVTYGQPGYSQALTQDLVNRLRANGRLRVKYIFFNDPGIRGVRPWPNHHNHLHVRFFPPAGVTPELEVPELAGELELAKRGPVSTTLSWQKSVITSYPPPNIPGGGGVYIVEKSEAPIYVGEAESFKARWSGRLQTAYQMGMVPGQPLTVWFGTYKPDSSLTRKEARNARTAIEHAVIRTLIKSGIVAEGALRNRRSFKQFDVIADIRILKLLPSPYLKKATVSLPEYRNNVLHFLKGNRSYELPAQEWGQELGL